MAASTILMTVGGVLIAGLALELLGRQTKMPRVTLLLAFGFLVGPDMLGLLPRFDDQVFRVVTNVALVMIGFLLGERFTFEHLRQHGRVVLWTSVMVVLVTTLVVAVGLLLVGVPLALALLLGAIASATDPAATYDVVDETHAKGPFTDTLTGVVAVDDAWGLLVFSVALAAVAALDGGSAASAVGHGAWEVGGAVMLGVALGLPLSRLAHRVMSGEPTVLEALGVVLLCGGLALWMGVSFILAAMVMGATTANLAPEHRHRPFHAIRHIERPFLVVFFVATGAALDPASLPAVGWLGLGYLTLRVVGRIAGGWLGALLGGATPAARRWTGVSLLPQAGVALGVALVAAERRPELADTLLAVVIGATVVFELIGPVIARTALIRTGEAGRGTDASAASDHGA